MRGVPLGTYARARQIIPGVLLAAAIALLAKRLTVGASISSVLIAIVLGALWRNLIGVHADAEAGLEWVARVLLRVGIALVGLRLTLGVVGDIASVALPITVACIATAFGVSALLARVLAVPGRLSDLLAVGTAVCGCTAVIAVSPTIRARPEETACALICVVIFGCIGMLAYPWVAHVFGGSPIHAGVFLGTAIHDTSQVIGAALIYAQHADAPDVVAAASATKMIRNLSLALLIPLTAWRYSCPQSSPGAAVGRTEVLPAFVAWFVVLVVIRSAGDIFLADTPTGVARWTDFIATGHTVSELCLICGMTGVGLGISFKQVRQIGWRAFAAGLLLAAAVATCSFVLTVWTSHA